jgi:hypothetical protein
LPLSRIQTRSPGRRQSVVRLYTESATPAPSPLTTATTVNNVTMEDNVCSLLQLNNPNNTVLLTRKVGELVLPTNSCLFAYFGHVRFQVLTASSMKMTSFWDIAPCSLVEVNHFSQNTRLYIPEGCLLLTLASLPG